MKSFLSFSCGIVMFEILQLMGYTYGNRHVLAYVIAWAAAFGMFLVFIKSKSGEDEFLRRFEIEKTRIDKLSEGRALVECEREPEGFYSIRIFIEKSNNEEAELIASRFMKMGRSYEFNNLVLGVQVLGVSNKNEISEERDFMRKKIQNEKSKLNY